MPDKTKETSNEATDVIDQALQVQESLDVAQDDSPLSLDERDAIHTEISDELSAMQSGAESASIPDEQSATPESTTPSSQLNEAKIMAQEIGGMIAGGAAMILGRDYGISQTALSKWSESMAPLLVKYNLTDMNQVMAKWGAEIQAGAGCVALGAGIFGAHRRYKIEDAEAAKAKKEGAKDNGNQSE